MTRIVRTHYRYKRPPRKRAKAAALEVPAVVTISEKTRKRVRRSDDTTAKPVVAERPATPPPDEPGPATETGKSAIVTARRPGKRRYADVPEVTEEEHRAIGDRADALMQEFKRQIAEKLR